MRLCRSVRIPLLCLCFSVCSLTTIAQIPRQRNALTGIRGVKVLILTTDSELKVADLTRDVLNTDVELRLRKDGVPVLEGAEWPKGYQKAVIVVRLVTAKHDDEIAITVIVQLWRVVESDPTMYISTWENIGVGLMSVSVVRANIRERIGDHIDRFANDYLAANPKP
jgi:hypothetical protein